jgi:hypothetical protein
LALVAGGGSAAAVQGITMATRAISTATTGGLGNPAVSTAEAGASFGLSLMALLIPMLAAALVVLTMFFGIRLVARKLMIKKETAPEKTEAA